MKILIFIDDKYWVMKYENGGKFKLCKKMEEAMKFYPNGTNLFYEVCFVMLSRYTKVQLVKI